MHEGDVTNGPHQWSPLGGAPSRRVAVSVDCPRPHRDGEKLLAAGADVNRENRCDLYTALMYATEEGHVDVVVEVLRAGAHPHTTNNEGECALTMACRDGTIGVIKVLLASGADVNQHVLGNGHEFDGFTPLIYAAQICSIPIVELLLEAGAALEEVNVSGYTALMHACVAGSVYVVSALLAAGANVNHESAFGTPLHAALRDDYHDRSLLVNVLLAAGANVDVSTDGPNTPLANAPQITNPQVVATLLSAGASVHFHDWSPLHLNSSLAHIRLFLDAGADVNCRNTSGETPLSVFASKGRSDVVELLLDAGADNDAVDSSGDTATAELIRGYTGSSR